MEVDKPRECTPRQQSNSITNYFHVARKRERAEEGEETSLSKQATLEKKPLPVSECTESSASSAWNSEKEQHGFERIRRITGYLVGSLDRFNDAKKAEESDRVKHDVESNEE